MAIDLTDKLDEATRAARTEAAIAAVPSLGAAPYARSEPAGVLTGPAGGITVDPFGPSSTVGSGLSGQGGVNKNTQFMTGKTPGVAPEPFQKSGRDEAGVITADSASRVYGNDMQRSGGVFGTTDMRGVNDIMARENKARGEMIDSMITSNGGNGVAILPDRTNEANEANEQLQAMKLSPKDYLSYQQGKQQQDASIAETVARHGITTRGQDLNYAASIAQQGLTARGQDLTAQNQRADNQLSTIRTGLDVERFGLEKQAAQRQQAASDALIQATASGDPAKVAQARQAAVAAGLKVEPAASLQHVETERGTMVFDPRTGRMVPAVGPDGAPVGSGKALTEFQGKSTGFGMRAQESSRIIDQVGQGGKVQPSLLKRAAESVPLVGEGLGMAANGLQSPEQQQVEQAQKNFVNAVLRQESGAAISASEFDNARKQYFPQPGDSPEVVAQKQANRESAINGFRISAGPGAKSIGGAPAQPQAAAPKVGMVDGKHVFLGGNPADPASWAEVR